MRKVYGTIRFSISSFSLTEIDILVTTVPGASKGVLTTVPYNRGIFPGQIQSSIRLLCGQLLPDGCAERKREQRPQTTVKANQLFE